MKFEVLSRSGSSKSFATLARSMTQSDSHKANELYILSRLFDRSGGNLPIIFPAIVELREKPDFVFASEGRHIGVEVTKFMPEQLARAESIARKERCGMVLTPFDYDSPNRNNDEIRARLQGHQVGLGDWVKISERADLHSDQMIKIILSKIKKVVVPNQQLFDEHWLIIEDGMNMSSLQVSHMMPIIQHGIRAHTGAASFDLVLFLFMDSVCGFYKGQHFCFDSD